MVPCSFVNPFTYLDHLQVLTIAVANHAMALQKSMIFMQCGGAAQGGASCEGWGKAEEKEEEEEEEDAHRTCRASRKCG
jgi:hypothetical protein